MKLKTFTFVCVIFISGADANASTTKYLHCMGGTVSAYSEVVINRGRGEEFKLRCGGQVDVLGNYNSDWAIVRLDKNRTAFVATLFLSNTKDDSGPGAGDLESSSHPAEYPLSIRVLQTEQVPYTVQVGGGQISTSCSINGTAHTGGSAIASGDVAFGSSTSNSSLTMNCNSYQAPQMGWRHVLNAMLVVASNGNAYIVACDAAWRWSKCRGLVAGDVFSAKMTDRGLAVEYFDGKGRAKAAIYAVLQSKVLGN
jgi:hypothetical protein